MFISVYMLVLTLLPCGDAFAHEDSFSPQKQIEQTASEHTDVCSSLCSCTCCGQLTYQETTLIYSFTIPIYFKEATQCYKEKITQNFSACVWQPPKIQI